MTYTCKAPGRRGGTADRKAPPAGPEAAQAPGRRARQGASSTPRRAGTKNPQLIRTHEGPQIPQETLGGKLEGSRRLTWKCTAKAPGGERPAPPEQPGQGAGRGPAGNLRPRSWLRGGARAARGWAAGGGAAGPAGARKQRGLAGSRPHTPEAGNVGSSPQGKAWDRERQLEAVNSDAALGDIFC